MLQSIKGQPIDSPTISLIRAAQQGDVDAFEQLYRHTHRKVYLFAKRMTGTVENAEEVVQETFIKAWQKLPSFNGEYQFYSWLRKIASRVCIDRLRIKNAKVWQLASDFDDIYQAINFDADHSRDLEKLIAKLPLGARSVFILHDIEGYKHKEIAEMTDIAVGTSKAQLSRARKLLRESLTV